MKFIKGQRVKRTYRHRLNSGSIIVITKYGTFIKEKNIQRQIGGKSWPERCGVVLFDGNKNPSSVLLEQLEEC